MESPFTVAVNWFRSRWSCDITSLKFGFSCQWSRIFKVFLSVISLYLALDYFGYHEKTHLIIVYYSAWNCAGIVFLTKFQLLLRANVSFKGTNFEINGGMLPKIQWKLPEMFGRVELRSNATDLVERQKNENQCFLTARGFSILHIALRLLEPGHLEQNKSNKTLIECKGWRSPSWRSQ